MNGYWEQKQMVEWDMPRRLLKNIPKNSLLQQNPCLYFPLKSE